VLLLLRGGAVTLGCTLVTLGCTVVTLGCTVVTLGCTVVTLGCTLVTLGCTLVTLGCTLVTLGGTVVTLSGAVVSLPLHLLPCSQKSLCNDLVCLLVSGRSSRHMNASAAAALVGGMQYTSPA
jgi:hypothetical protein